MKQRFGLALCLLLFVSSAGAATLTSHSDEAAFRAALPAGVIVHEEYFDGFSNGVVVNTQISGVTISSTHAGESGYVPVQIEDTNRAITAPAILSGGFLGSGPTSQSIVATFAPAVRGVSFWVVAQHPEALDIHITFDFQDGTSQTIPLPDNDQTNTNREFVGVTADAPISRATYVTNDQSGGLFNKFGGWDNLIFAALDDDTAPICLDEPGFRGAVFGVEVACTDNGPKDSGISSVVLAPDAVNLTLLVDPFVPPAPVVTFFVYQTDSMNGANGTTTAADVAGNSDDTQIDFSVLNGGVVVNQTVCNRDGVLLDVTNNNLGNPAQTTSCSGSGIIGEPAFPFGYEPLPGTRVLTIDSGITGDTSAGLEVVGDFEPRMRGLYAHSDDGGLTFDDFVDLTEEVIPIPTVPDPTKVNLKEGKWSVVKYTFAIQAEICDGLDNDGDGLIDEGFEIPLAQCTTAPVDPAICDVDGDGYFVCGDPASRGATFVSVDCADQLGFVHPGAVEQCNGLDDDCDGVADDGNPGGGQSCAVAGQSGVCATGETSCVLSQIQCNQTIFPGDLAEVCDGADNDCDGTTDEPDAVDAPTWYADSDGDGYGDPATAQPSCSQPAGYVADNADCDDSNAANNPLGTEVCDGADNDCDGVTDEPDAVGAPTWYVDADGDGYGNPAVSQVSCAQPAGYVADDTDCDDNVATTNPGAADVCDGVDNDCNGVVDNYVCVQLDGYLVEIVPGSHGEFPVTDADGNSVFAYRISGAGALGGFCGGVKKVSHADELIPVCDPLSREQIDILTASPNYDLLKGGQGDPSTGFGVGDLTNDVLKWYTSPTCQETAIVSLTAAGTIDSGATPFMIKAGNKDYRGPILGPHCALP